MAGCERPVRIAPAPTTCIATEFERGFSRAADPMVGLEEELIRAIMRKLGVGGLLAWLADTTEAAPSTLRDDAHAATTPELRLGPAPRSKNNAGHLDRALNLRGLTSVEE